VFKDLTLSINLGEVTIIEGENGSGKSTLIQLLLKYHRPQCGEIFINGIPYSSLSHDNIRKHVAFIPQTVILLNRTIYENIVYGLSSPPSKKEVEDLMEQQKLGGFLASLPNGLDSEVGMYGSYLSGGQRQIVWILKTMLMDPYIVIMDEPTASIDQENKHIIVRLIDTMLKNHTKDGKKRTAIMITHDPVFKDKTRYPEFKFLSL
jgi:ABC-type multidrug transport system fused ATPase/permease subunit